MNSDLPWIIEGGIALALFLALIGVVNFLLKRHFKQVDGIEKKMVGIRKKVNGIEPKLDAIGERSKETARKLDKTTKDLSYLRGAFDELSKFIYPRREGSPVGTTEASRAPGESDRSDLAAEGARGGSSSTRS